MRVLVTAFLVALAAEVINAADVCVASTVTEACETGETGTPVTCTACSTHTTLTTCGDASCTWTAATCKDDCPAIITDATCGTTAGCSWTGTCDDVCAANNENACTTTAVADCTWDTPGTCTDTCTSHVDTGTCTTDGVNCEWGTTCTSTDGALDCPANNDDQAGCDADNTACSWTAGSAPLCKPKGSCGADEGNCGTGCDWTDTGCANDVSCPADEATCGTTDGCSWEAVGTCGNTAGTACNTYMNQTMCCAHDACKWMECSGNGSGCVMPSLLVLLLLPVNLLTRF